MSEDIALISDSLLSVISVISVGHRAFASVAGRNTSPGPESTERSGVATGNTGRGNHRRRQSVAARNTPPGPESAERSSGTTGNAAKVGHRCQASVAARNSSPRPESAERSSGKGHDTLTRQSPKPKHLGYPFTTARASLQKQHGLASPPYSRNPCPWLTTFSSTSAPFGARFN